MRQSAVASLLRLAETRWNSSQSTDEGRRMRRLRKACKNEGCGEITLLEGLDELPLSVRIERKRSVQVLPDRSMNQYIVDPRQHWRDLAAGRCSHQSNVSRLVVLS